MKEKIVIYDGYKIFTPGPVKMSDEVLSLGAKQTPYFRNEKFSHVLLSCEKMLLKMLNAPKGSRVIFLTASGTAGLEAVVMNLLSKEDEAIVVNGGGFGQRFVDICKSYEVNHLDFKVENTNLADINEREFEDGFNTFIVNAHETSLGHLYDLEAIGSFCKKHKLLNIVDAISMFVTDELDMQKQNIDAVILSSQKGLALPPGLSMIVLNERAINRIGDVKSHYFNFKDYLKDGKRGQTPYTPCVSIILQLEERLKQIQKDGGVKSTIKKAKELAEYFRENIKDLPFEFFTPFMPNAMTTLSPTNGKIALQIVKELEVNEKIIVCPNGGEVGEKIFRVSHMGDMSLEYVDSLIEALRRYK